MAGCTVTRPTRTEGRTLHSLALRTQAPGGQRRGSLWFHVCVRVWRGCGDWLRRAGPVDRIHEELPRHLRKHEARGASIHPRGVLR